jgi:hypothetical protein
MSAFSNNDRGLATGSTDANRASIRSVDHASDPAVVRSNTRSVGMSGAERVTVRSGAGAPEQQVDHNRQPGFSANNLNSGASRVTVGGSGTEKTSEGFARASSNVTEGRFGVASITSFLGSPRSGSDVRETDVVTLPNGMQTDVKSAVNSGFLRRAADGSYHDVGAQEIAQEEYEREQHRAEVSTKEAAVASLDNENEVLMNHFVSRVSPTDGALAVKAIIDGQEINDDLYARAASRMGTEPTIVKQQVAQLTEAFNQQALEYVGPKVLEHARAHEMPALREAARTAVMTGSMEGFKAIAEKHMLSLDRTDAQAIVTSPDGIKLGAQFNKSTGEVTLEIPGVGRTTWGAAIRAGLIQPYFPVKRR